MHLDNVLYLYANLEKNNKFLISMIILIVFLLILILIVSYLSKEKEKKELEQKRLEYKKNLRKNIKILNFDEEEKKEIKKSEIKLETEKINDPKEEIEIIEVMDENLDDEIENIKNAIKDNKNEQTINLNKWEREQEENAIISYDELVRKAGAKKIVYKTKKKKEESKVEQVNVNDNKFKPSKVISPIYGAQERIEELDDEITAFSRIERLKSNDEEENMKTDIEFLNKLKKFRNELGIK